MSRTALLRPSRPLQRREVVTLVLFSLVALAQGWTGAAITHVLPFVQDDYHLSDADVFGLMTVIRVASLAAIAFSWWGDRRGRRTPLLLAFALLPVATLLSAVTDGAGWLAATQSVARVGTIALGGLALVVLAEEIGPEVRGYAVGLYALVGAMGTGLGLLLRPLGAGTSDGWRLLFALSALPLIGLPLLARRLKESRMFTPPPNRPAWGAVLSGGLASRLWPLAIISFSVSAFTSPAANLALLRLEQSLGWSAGGASLVLAITSAPGVILGVLIGGRLADVLGRRPTEALALSVGVAGGMAFYTIDGGWVMVVGILASNLGAFAFAPAFAAHRAELFPTHLRATAGAWIVNASIVGGIFGFAAGRFVVDAWGISGTVTALGVMVLVSMLFIVPLPETRGLHLEGSGPAVLSPPL
jgi:MFS family permease